MLLGCFIHLSGFVMLDPIPVGCVSPKTQKAMPAKKEKGKVAEGI